MTGQTASGVAMEALMRVADLEAEVDRLRGILDGEDMDAVERVALALFARSFIPTRTVDQVRPLWEEAPESTLQATRWAALDLIRAAGARPETDENRKDES